ncbi:hypothetical protein NDA13_001114 [Ustilago tritici]|nr:hypothetical protein NDA13_001770 [Ustilago tritici]KAJ1033115.1 hypothetical protein NDA13_001114 [Ustilago tritici]
MESIKHTIAENLGVAPTLSGDPHKLVDTQYQFELEQVGDLSGKVALVTGGSEGIGFGCTHTLLKAGISKVFVMSMSEEILSQAKDAFDKDEELPQDAASRIVWKRCDLMDWKHVQQTTQKFQTKVRVVSLSSNLAAQTPKEIEFDTEEDFKTDIGPQPLYSRSKLANLLFIRYLNRKYSLEGDHTDVIFNACHPGIVETRQSQVWIHEPFPILGYGMNLINPIKKDIFQGSVSAMYCATQPTKGGNLICPPAIPEDGPEKSRDEDMQDRLARLSEQVIERAGVTLTTIPV